MKVRCGDTLSCSHITKVMCCVSNELENFVLEFLCSEFLRHSVLLTQGKRMLLIVQMCEIIYEEMKLPTSSQGTVLFRNLSDLSCPWGSLCRT